ncbi:transketolase [Lachnospiraceae bacterium]|nr:transketolase [Lachnospiraceae bacterium]
MDSTEMAWRIRRHTVEMTHVSHGSHIAPAFSCADIIAVLYTGILNISPQNLQDKDRDIFIMSKGHAGAAVYAALAECGFIPKEQLLQHYANGSVLSGHVSHKGVPGVEFSTGSLGHGCCVAAGMALAKKKDKRKGRVFALVGDGECEEGSVWEMALFAKHYSLGNFTVIVDHNKMQSLDYCDKTIGLTKLKEKWEAFGWTVKEADGHDHEKLKHVLKEQNVEDPCCIIAHTVKGKGVSFMENNILWHYRDPQGEYYDAAVKELERKR